eukprot:3449844-Amphidinium_carterae.1
MPATNQRDILCRLRASQQAKHTFLSIPGAKENERKLDYVLGLTAAKIMERRLQTKAQQASVIP